MSTLKNSYDRTVLDQPKNVFLRPFTVDGERASDDNMNVNGSITPVEFWVNMPIDKMVSIQNIILAVSDSGAPAVDDYGSITGGLVNGVQFFIDIGGLGGTRLLLQPVLRLNVELVKTATILNIYNFAASDRIITYQKRYYTFSDGIELDGRRGDTLGLIIQDDCTPLLQHHVSIEGFETVAQV